MNNNQFLDTVGRCYLKCLDILSQKNQEYATKDNRFANFDDTAERDDITPERALYGMMGKHITGLNQYIKDIDNEIYRTQNEWDEKIVDAINYLFLLNGIVHRRKEW